MAHRFGQFVLLAAVCFEPGLRAQDGASLRLVDERLQDAHRLAEHHAFVFVGGISRMETVSRPRCRTGVEEKLEYSISTLLWNDPESYAENGSKVAKGFTDCTQRRLPAPFFEGTKLIVYCEAEPVRAIVVFRQQSTRTSHSRTLHRGSKSCGRKRAIRCCCRFTNISAIRSSYYPAGRFFSLARSQVGKRLIAFCCQRNDECYGGDETLGIIDDSDEIFRAIQGLISKVN
jgi:hypothetical protein